MMLDNFWQNYGSYITAPIVLLLDNWAGVAAFILFILQVIYMRYKIAAAKKDCEK